MVKWISQRSSEPSFQVRILVGAQKCERSEDFCAPTASRLREMRQDSNEKPVYKNAFIKIDSLIFMNALLVGFSGVAKQSFY